MLLWYLAVSILPHEGAKERIPLFEPRALAIVYAKAIKTTDDERLDAQLSTWRITHVYAGGQDVKKEDFTVALYKTWRSHLLSGTPNMFIKPLIKEGEEGIWWIHTQKHSKEKKRFAYLRFGRGDQRYFEPARKGVTPDAVFKRMVAFAETVEAACGVHGDERVALLAKLIRSPNCRTADWAICHLGSYSDTYDYLLQVVREQLARTSPDREHVRSLLRELDDSSFHRREAATKSLRKLGFDVVPALGQALRAKPSPEARRRIEGLLTEIHRGLQDDNENPTWTILRIVLQPDAPNMATEVFRDLEELAKQHSGSWLDQELRAWRKARGKSKKEFSIRDQWRILVDSSSPSRQG